MDDAEHAAQMISDANAYIIQVLRKLKTDRSQGFNFGTRKYFVDNLLDKFNPTVIKEVKPGGSDTAFVIGKGDKFGLCLRSAMYPYDFHDMSLIKFVLLHEISHIGSIGVGHDAEFWGNFAYLLRYAQSQDLYEPVNYRDYPTVYCGLPIRNNPYYD